MEGFVKKRNAISKKNKIKITSEKIKMQTLGNKLKKFNRLNTLVRI